MIAKSSVIRGYCRFLKVKLPCTGYFLGERKWVGLVIQK
ncbi:hypothetical protein A33Q_2766 [Indibacter alkaliphilus LW1]|uniref:Uncharacterized protein n=1 Tax=Indibacter alkaliphilus (strain CCUG 57479 / KCTC 22604 / LW1) TaxID=1189612 RepID=S2E252_INDAL|nr:hypothetical protein A33Q_2766 [Indibacter alkaliphilus LW1]